MPSPVDTSRLRCRLLAWFRVNQRTLPWRSSPTPYRVWISEIMLQQTQVATALPYFDRFVKRFPDVACLAAAPIDDVLTLWAGLGYYSRARNLHRTAIQIVQRFSGRLPSAEADLLSLPGIGRYTAGAIRSIAFNLPAPILDGNVTRVLSRVFALDGDPKSPNNQKTLWRLAGQMVGSETPGQTGRDRLRPQPGTNAGDINQAMMELGALLCSPRSPACPRCPAASLCRAHASRREEDFPADSRPAKVLAERWAVAGIPMNRNALVSRLARRHRQGSRPDRYLLVKRETDTRWGGLWEFPGLIVTSARAAMRELEHHLCQLLGETIALRRVGQVKHQLSHRAMRVDVFAADPPRATSRDATVPKRCHGQRAVAIDQLQTLAVSTLTRKIAAVLEPTPPRPARRPRPVPRRSS